MRHVFIVNPIAGGRDISGLISLEAEKVLGKDGFEIIKTERAGHAVEIASGLRTSTRAGDEKIRVYSCGGDGTLNEILCGIEGSENILLGVYPCGTGNDFIKAFGDNSFEVFTDLRMLINAQGCACDLMYVNDRPCINIASVGFDASVAENVHRFSKIPVFKKIAYELSLGYCYFTKLSNHFMVKVDDREPISMSYMMLCAANGKYYGGGFMAAPEADIYDGLIDFISVRSVSRLKVLSLISCYKNGRHIKNGTSTVDVISFERCKKIKISYPKPIPVNVDGEIITMENPEIRIMPAAINFLVPAPFSPTIY